MEAFVGLVLVIAAIASLVFFKGTLAKSGNYTENIVTTHINEKQTDLIKRSEEAYRRLVKECGEDFKTPQDIYDIMQRKHNETLQ